jgi:hypothetical protein
MKGITMRMITMSRSLFLAAAVFALPTWASPAAQPDLDTSTRAALQTPLLDPGVYLRSRLRAPHAKAALDAQPVSVSLAIVQHGPGIVQKAPRAAYAGLDDKAVRALQEQEDRALLLGAIGRVVVAKEPAALPALQALLSSSAEPAVRAEAAARLGELSPQAAVTTTLLGVADDDSGVVREAAMAGLAAQRSDSSLNALLAFAVDGRDAVRQVAALRALPVAGSAWAWKAQGDVARGAAFRADALRALDSVNGGGDVAAAVKDARARLSKR